MNHPNKLLGMSDKDDLPFNDDVKHHVSEFKLNEDMFSSF
jgi:hypothetical protein